MKTVVRAVLALVLAGSAVMGAAPEPVAAIAGATYLCGPTSTYACTGGGYAGVDPWGYHNSSSRDSAGRRHNCTAYAAFRAAQNGSRHPGRNLGNATTWDDNARAAGFAVNQNPTVGSIAQWNASTGHVAYVEEVTSTYIVTSDDNYGLNTTTRQRIPRGAAGWPNNFIHFADVSGGGPTAPGAPTGVSASIAGDVATVSFGAPSTGGAATTYTVTSAKDGISATSSVSPIVVGGVSAGTAHTFYVTASNAAGRGPAAASGTVLSAPGTDGSAVSVDVTGDGLADQVAFYDYGGADTGIYLQTGTTAGTLGTPRMMRRTGPGQWDMRSAKYLSGDFNGDRRSDIMAFYRYANSKTVAWLYDGTKLSSPPTIAWDSGEGNWTWDNSEFVAGDTNADGVSDVVAFYDYGSADMGVELFAGTQSGLLQPGGITRTGPGSWDVRAAKYLSGDFTGDGRSDVMAMYYYGDSHTRAWLFSGSALTSPPVERWNSGTGQWNMRNSEFVSADVDGNGINDIVGFYDYGNAQLGVWRLTNTATTTSTPQLMQKTEPGAWGLTSAQYSTGDVNGDGRTDVIGTYRYPEDRTRTWVFPGNALGSDPIENWHSGTGQWNGANSHFVGSANAGRRPNRSWYLRNQNSAGGSIGGFSYGSTGDIPVAGDWDGNGTTTIGTYRGSTSTWYLRNANSAGSSVGAFTFGSPGDVPVVGDWDGNGTTTIGVYRPSTGTWYVRNSNSSGPSTGGFTYGTSGDVPVVGDWDGNRTSTVGLFRPSTSTWYLRNANTAAAPTGGFVFGSPGDRPVVGNWDAVGGDSIGVHRPSSSAWYLRNSNSSGPSIGGFTFGSTGDQAVTGNWDGSAGDSVGVVR